MNRRSLTQAISIEAPDVKEFLKAGVPTPKAVKLEVVEEVAPATPKQQPPAPPAVEALSEKPKARVKAAPAPVEERPEVTVTVTYRLPEKLVSAMISASADRKVRRIKPSTQQSMVALAIEEWLNQNNYL